MFDYNIINNPLTNISKNKIDKIFSTISNIISKKQNGTLNIVFIDDNSIKKLNKEYRKIDRVTDVLSFHYFTDFSKLSKKDIAGEILLNYNKIKSQAQEQGHSQEKEFYILLIHSILHILGYDHETDTDYEIMNNFEKKIFKEVFEKE